MTLDKRIELQTKFTSLNVIWIIFAVGMVLLQILTNIENITFLPLYITFPFFLLEVILVYWVKVKIDVKIILFAVFRYIQILATIYIMCCTIDYNLLYFVYAILGLFVFIIEYYMVFDVYEGLQRSLCFITIVLAMTFVPLVSNIILKKIDSQFIYIYLFFANLSIAFIYISRLFMEYLVNITQELLNLRRMVDNVKETNDALNENQEKVKKANELLGVQKVKLEAAYQKINNVNAEMMIQNQIISYISSSLELGKVMQLITEAIIDKMKVQVCAIVLYPNATFNRKVFYKVKTNFQDNYRQLLINHIENFCFDQYIREGKTYVDNHVTNRYDFIKDNFLGSILIVPLVKDKKVIGALYVGDSTYDYFYENKSFYEAIVSQFMVALNNANLYKRMESMAIRDGLTGIYNRRFLTRMFQETIKNAVRNNQCVSVVLFDIDFFKSINDNYGHGFGDVAIQTIAKLGWTTAKENGGIIGRYGGEEFVIIFPNKNVEESFHIIQDLHQKIRNMQLKHSSGIVDIDVSMGLTSYPETCKNPEELLSRADWSMYYSKQAGRGCITIDSEEVQRAVNRK